MAKTTQRVSEADLERFAGYNAIRHLRYEIAIARLTLERLLKDADVSGDWLAYAEPITKLLDTVVVLIQENRKIDPIYGNKV